MIRLEQVHKTFADGTAALEGLDLAVAPGEFVALLGPSGCGKSTALRLIAGLADPTAGTIARRPPARPGFVFQDPTLMPWRTVRANVRLPLQMAGTPRAEADSRATAALARVGLAGFETAYPRQLSGGMKMRVSIARALVTAPALLLLDEPFAALDEITRPALNDDLLTLWSAERLAVLFVTHSIFESVYLATRVLVMSRRPGRIIADIPINAPTRGETFRTSAEYGALCRTVSAALREAMAA